ncbi:hypothetical protein J1N35_001167, partial [Gossypium stocksii]
ILHSSCEQHHVAYISTHSSCEHVHFTAPALYWSYVKDSDITPKRSLQKNFTKPMPEFLNFPKALLPLSEARCVEQEPVEMQSDKEKYDNPKKEKTTEKEP